DVGVSLLKHGSPFTNYCLSNRAFDLTTSWMEYSVQFTTSGFTGTANDARLMFWLAPYDANGDRYFFDEVVLAKVNVSVPPAITTHPSSQSVSVGETATFSVVGTGAAPLSYQWKRNGLDINGATSVSYTTPPVTMSDSGASYRCVVINSFGSVTSNAAILMVTAGTTPTITMHPTDQAVTVGQTATFSVTATGTPPLSYQWQKNNVDISGATNASYTSPATTMADSGATFRCVVTNSAGSDTSNAAVLSVNPVLPPSITTQPRDTTVTVGQTAMFSLVATGTAPLFYQWQKNGVNISGATSSSYTTSTVTMADSGATFRCVVRNSAGSVTSNLATLTVKSAQGANIVSNPGFELGTASWFFYTSGGGTFSASPPVAAGALAGKLVITTQVTNVQLFQSGLILDANTKYQLSFSAYSTSGHDLAAFLQRHDAPYTSYGLNGYVASLATGWQTFSTQFTTSGFSGTVSNGRLRFWFAPYATAGDVYYIDNVVLEKVMTSGAMLAQGESSSTENLLPTQYSLGQNYPNPVNPSTTIRYALPVASHVTLKVFNLLGQEVAALVKGIQDAGFKSVTFDASGLPSAVYFYKLQAGDFVETKRLLVVK
ncbi:MAG: immunoglobulin domain-containing protein, partial [Bacteroidota bacterium]